MKNRIGIVGAGSWGTALALHLARLGREVLLQTRDAQQADKLRALRENPVSLEGMKLPESIVVLAPGANFSGAAALLIAVPSKAVVEVATTLASVGLEPGLPLVSCTKGIDYDSGLRMTQLIARAMPGHPVGVLSGPSHAEEVAHGLPAAVVAGAAEPGLADQLQMMFSGGNLRVYGAEDVAGIELGGALKNIFAIAAGAGDGLGLGDNSKAALMTRSLAEMVRLGVALGGRRETFYGLSGLGDLAVTCFSQHSRNRRLGEWLGQGMQREEAEAKLVQVAEGVPATRSTWKLAQAKGIRAPVTEVVHRMLFENLPAADAVAVLMERDLRREHEEE